MKIIRSLLERYITIPEDIDAQRLGEIITHHIAEVEEVIDEAKDLEHVVVGYVKSMEKHSNADNLQVCQVEIGSGHYETDTVQIVCGGSNVVENAKVVVALPGAKVRWHGEGELMTLKKVKLRGEISHGMICAANELGLEDIYIHEHKEIVLLPDDAPIGALISEYAHRNEIIIDIDNKALTHRPDLWGHYGFARDLAAVLNIPFQILDNQNVSSEKLPYLQIENQATDFCSSFALQQFTTGLPCETPAWIQRVLSLSGIQSVNSLVDISNLVMILFGQPLHFYDARQIQGTVCVRSAQDNETITTLDGKEYTLVKGDLVIVDEARILGIAGIMGGQDTEIREDTTEIIIEAATFDAVSIRMTANRLGLQTEAAKRFEKSLDPLLPQLAISQAALLLHDVQGEACCPSSQFTQLLTLEDDRRERRVLYDPSHAELIMSKMIPEAQSILERLGFVVDSKHVPWQILVPSWRAGKDIVRSADIAEEISRVLGYNDIIAKPLSEAVKPSLLSDDKKLQRTLSHLLKGYGFHETMTYSFIGNDLTELSGLKLDNAISLTNSLSSEHTHLRHSLLPNLLDYVHRSRIHRPDCCVFEIGNIFQNPAETMRTAMAIFLKLEHKVDPEIIYDAKAYAEGILDYFGADWSVSQGSVPAQSHPYRYCQYSVNNKPVISVYELHPTLVKQWKWKKTRVAVIDFCWDVLLGLSVSKLQYQTISPFPSIMKGISLYIDHKFFVQDLLTGIYDISATIADVSIADVYDGSENPDGQKAVVIDIIYADSEKTLQENDIELDHVKVMKHLEAKGATIRMI